MRTRRPLIALMALSVMSIGVFAVTPAPAASTIAGPLHTTLNQIIDANGQPLRLRGINSGKLFFYPWVDYTAPEFGNTSLDAMRAWGVNTVRIALGEQYWFQSVGCRYKATPDDYATAVGYAVHQVTSRGMLAILNLTWNTEVSPPACYGAGQHPMADAARSITMWKQVAQMFKYNPLVAFDLYNEPHDISWDVWKNGGMVRDRSTGIVYRAAGMQQMYDAVRSTGAQNLVLVTGNGWGNVPPDADDLITGSNIVYAAHYYTCPTKPPPALNCKLDPMEPAPAGQRLDKWTPLSVTAPVMVTEFGWPDPNNGLYNQRVIAWAESRGISWTAFTWGNPSKYNPFGLVNFSNWTATAGGTPVRNGLALNP